MKRIVVFVLIVAMAAGVTACAVAENGQKSECTDYSKEASWMEISAGIKPVDCFFIYPTVTLTPENGSQNISIENEEHRNKAKYSRVAQASVFEESCNLYVPYYRQMNMETYALEDQQEIATAAAVAYEDIKAAFEYFIQNLNEERPFIIAGHSQGSIMTSMLLADVMKDEALQSRMVAAYAIGWPITQDYMDKNPHLRYAEGANDVGVIVSFNTAAQEAAEEETMDVNPLAGGICINPINWRKDEKTAPASENSGSVFFDENTYERIEEERYADATINQEKGIVVCTTDTNRNEYAISAPLFPETIYHMTEYGFYYKNLQQNVANRIAFYWEQQGGKNK